MSNIDAYELDRQRYGGGGVPIVQRFFRRYQSASSPVLKAIYKLLFKVMARFDHIEIAADTPIGAGLYMGHPYCITINPKAVLGRNINIHKGVTIGQENRGQRKGVPVVRDCVWIGVNATIVGKITIGNDVLIAPNSYVNRDVPDHSVVYGNPCVIKHRENATENYVNNRV